ALARRGGRGGAALTAGRSCIGGRGGAALTAGRSCSGGRGGAALTAGRSCIGGRGGAALTAGRSCIGGRGGVALNAGRSCLGGRGGWSRRGVWGCGRGAGGGDRSARRARPVRRLSADGRRPLPDHDRGGARRAPRPPGDGALQRNGPAVTLPAARLLSGRRPRRADGRQPNRSPSVHPARGESRGASGIRVGGSTGDDVTDRGRNCHLALRPGARRVRAVPDGRWADAWARV